MIYPNVKHQIVKSKHNPKKQVFSRVKTRRNTGLPNWEFIEYCILNSTDN